MKSTRIKSWNILKTRNSYLFELKGWTFILSLHHYLGNWIGNRQTRFQCYRTILEMFLSIFVLHIYFSTYIILVLYIISIVSEIYQFEDNFFRSIQGTWSHLQKHLWSTRSCVSILTSLMRWNWLIASSISRSDYIILEKSMEKIQQWTNWNSFWTYWN